MDTNLIEYYRNLVKPNGKAPAGRKAWSIDLENVWLPFFTASNVMGHTDIPNDALGAPLRLAYNPDGSVKFTSSGKPVIRVAKPIAEAVKLVRENFTAGLVAFANGVAMESPEAYKAQVESDRQALQAALASLEAQAIVQSPAKPQADAKPKSKAKAEVKAQPQPQPKPQPPTEAQAKPEADKVLVPA